MEFYKIKRLFANIAFPPKCMSCNKLIDIEKNAVENLCLCPECKMKYNIAKAKVCGECNMAVSKCVCGIKKRGIDVKALPKVMFYSPDKENGIESKIIFSLKHKNDIRYARFAADEMCVSLSAYLLSEGIDPADCIITWVPRRAQAVSRDGFDHGERIAKQMSNIFGNKKAFKKLLVRRGGKEQKKLSARDRKKNISSSVSLKKNADEYVFGKIVIIVDDLVTSGATMSVAREILLSAGALRVVCASMARTVVK